VVLDIGAGDLRFARMMAEKGCQVIAVEIQAQLIGQSQPLPANLQVVIADARTWSFPPAVDVGVLLMRHCRDFGLYVRKLRASGCQMLVTNARWRMAVEAVPLQPASRYSPDRAGWSACVCCGAVMFIPGDTDGFEYVNVEGCPQCSISS
jgi:hypothetical protein